MHSRFSRAIRKAAMRRMNLLKDLSGGGESPTGSKRKRPYGHKSYSRKTKSGKVSYIKSKGVPPVEELTPAGSAAHLGGAGSKTLHQDKEGNKYIFKPAVTKHGGQSKEYAAHVQEAFANIVGQIKDTVPVKAVTMDGKVGTLQPLLETKHSALTESPASLTESDKEDIAAEHVVDWLLSQHDSHGKNFIKTENGWLGVDKEQGFKYFGKDELSTSYHPNEKYGEQEPYYNKFWRSWGSHNFDFDPKVLEKYIERAEAIPDDEYRAELKAYADSLHGASSDNGVQFLNKAVERKNNLRSNFEKFITDLYQQRNGTEGQFTFAEGWKASKKKLAKPSVKVKHDLSVDKNYDEEGEDEAVLAIIHHLKKSAKKITDDKSLDDALDKYFQDNYEHETDEHRAGDVALVKKLFEDHGVIQRQSNKGALRLVLRGKLKGVDESESQKVKNLVNEIVKGWTGSSKGKTGLKLRGAIVAVVCGNKLDDCNERFEAEARAATAAIMGGPYDDNRKDHRDSKDSCLRMLQDGSRDPLYQKALVSLAKKSQEDLPDTITVYRGIRGSQGAEVRANGKWADTGAVCSFAETEFAARKFLNGGGKTALYGDQVIIKVEIPRECVIFNYHKFLDKSNTFYQEQELAIATRGRIHFDSVILKSGILEGLVKAVRFKGTKKKKSKEFKIVPAGVDPPNWKKWKPIPFREERHPSPTKPKKSKRVHKAEKFPYPLYEEQRQDIKGLIEQRSPLTVEEMALRPHPELDGYVGVFKAGLKPYLFSYAASTGFYYKPAKDLDKANQMFDHLMEREQKLALERRRKESTDSLRDWADKVSKAFVYDDDSPRFIKALPKKPKDKPVKQSKPPIAAGKKAAGKGGQTRYGYQSQGKESAAPGAAGAQPGQGQKKTEADTSVTPQPEPTQYVDPGKLAALLQTTVEVLKRVAKRFIENPKLGRKQGFIQFFQTKFPDFLAKHKIQQDYLGMLFDSLTKPQPGQGS